MDHHPGAQRRPMRRVLPEYQICQRTSRSGLSYRRSTVTARPTSIYYIHHYISVQISLQKNRNKFPESRSNSERPSPHLPALLHNRGRGGAGRGGSGFSDMLRVSAPTLTVPILPNRPRSFVRHRSRRHWKLLRSV